MPTEKMAVGIWTVRMLTKLNNRVTKTIAQMPKMQRLEVNAAGEHKSSQNRKNRS